MKKIVSNMNGTCQYTGFQSKDGVSVSGIRKGVDITCTLNVISLSVFVLGMSFYLIATPKNADDYLYMLDYRDWFLSQHVNWPEDGGDVISNGFPWQEVLQSWKEHYVLDNGRLGNMLMTLFLVFPKWLGSGVSAICLIYAVWGILKLSDISIRHSRVVVPGVFMLTFMLPWWENMGSLAYQFNYLFPTVLSVMLVLYSGIIPDYRSLRRRVHGTVPMLVSFFLGLVLGGTHEGFAVPFVVGIIAVCIFDRNQRTPVVCSASVGLVIGLIYLGLSPGMQYRLHDTLGGTVSFLKSTGFLFTALPAMFMTGIAIVFARTKRITADPFLVFCLASAWASLAIVIATNVAYKAGWWGIFISITGILYLLNHKFETLKGRGLSIWSVLCVVMCGAVAVHMFAISRNALHQREMMRIVFEKSNTYGCEFGFGKVYTMQDMSFASGITGASFLTDGCMYIKNYHYGTRSDEYLYSTIIPEEFEHLSAEDGTSVNSSARIRKIGNRMYMPSLQETNYSLLYMDVDFGDGFIRVPMRRYRFQSMEDGQYYDYLSPVTGWYSSHFKTIRSIRW